MRTGRRAFLALFLVGAAAWAGCELTTVNGVVLAEFLPTGVGSVPWGGHDPSRWKAEASIANAASEKISAAWRDPRLRDVVVAVPTRFNDSDYRPYGDGQTNSEPSFGLWRSPRPPLVLTLRTYEGGRRELEVEFDARWDVTQTEIEIAFGDRRVIVPGHYTNGRLQAVWRNVPEELRWNDPAPPTPVFVRPHPRFDDWFPVSFRLPRRTIDEVVASLPPQQRRFARDDRPLADPEELARPGTRLPPLQHALGHHRFPSYRYNVSHLDASGNPLPYTPDNVHGRFGGPDGRVTAVGRGYTWVAERETPFKVMYVGFDGRNVEAETQHGVTSGCGWHAMGDAIALVNSVERTPVVIGAGFSGVALRRGQHPPGGASYSYGLSDIAVVGLLMPGEVFLTELSDPPFRTHQWYAIPSGSPARGFLAEEWDLPRP